MPRIWNSVSHRLPPSAPSSQIASFTVWLSNFYCLSPLALGDTFLERAVDGWFWTLSRLLPCLSALLLSHGSPNWCVDRGQLKTDLCFLKTLKMRILKKSQQYIQKLLMDLISFLNQCYCVNYWDLRGSNQRIEKLVTSNEFLLPAQ